MSDVCICLHCAAKNPESAAERRAIVKALYADPHSKVSQEPLPLASDLISSSDTARFLQVTLAAVSNWKVRYEDFPKPYVTLNEGTCAIYRKQEIVEWAVMNRKMPVEYLVYQA